MMMHVLTLLFLLMTVQALHCQTRERQGANTQLVILKEDHDEQGKLRLQIEAREKMQAELNKQEEQKKLEAKQAEQLALAAAKAAESEAKKQASAIKKAEKAEMDRWKKK
jgi:hypothetical protein